MNYGTRIRQNTYTYCDEYESINFRDIYDCGYIVKLQCANIHQQEFPFGLITKADGRKVGDRLELYGHPAYRFNHIDHKVLLNEGRLKHVLKSGSISLQQIDNEISFDCVSKFEVYLLRTERASNNNKMTKLQNTINTNNTQIINKHFNEINGALNSINYSRRCGAPMSKSTTLGLAGFLLFVRHPFARLLKNEDIDGWSITGSKPNRTFNLNLKECRQTVLDSFFKDDTLYRQKKSGKKTIYYKGYNLKIKYTERTIKMVTHFKIASKDGSRGRWNYTG